MFNTAKGIRKSISLRFFATRSSRHYNQSKKSDEDDYTKAKRHRNVKEESTNEEEKEHRNIYLHKSRGQHILTNPRVLDAIVSKADIKPTDTVLEIGPGTGNLTIRLLGVAKKVIAVEIDKRMVGILNKRVSEHGFEEKINVVSGDALKSEFPRFDLVVANIPYGISSPLIAKLVFGDYAFRSATLLLQKEFVRRLLAKPGDSEFNRLAVNVKLVADAKFVMDVSKRDFVPCPRVDSSVVRITPKDEVPDVNMNEWLSFTRTCFSKKNKTLGATFKQKRKVAELLRISQLMSEQNENVIVANDVGDIGESIEEIDEEKEQDSDVEKYLSDSNLGTEMSLFKDKIVEVLKEGGFEDKRPSKLSNEELLCLLSLFNRSGIRFHDCSRGNVDPDVV
ncbi:hypothetical protein MKW94_026248 [Papaver nudicaule]|uniref:rRNA adenine N(6)-methyltransferase n=1 Tax=Papaver nudicaule TaxID=74823 RepID=A0AA41V9N7_PAPNU|nr:hypothetical protein [Papaver nudicaule]